MGTIFRMVNRLGRAVLTVYLEVDTNDGYRRYAYMHDSGGGRNVSATRIDEVIADISDWHKSARIIGQWPIDN